MVLKKSLVALCLLCTSATTVYAHFGMVIPETNIMTQDLRETNIALSFSHPFELAGMDLAHPAKFTVTANGSTTDLTDTLQPVTIMDHKGWQTNYKFNRPGVYQFAMEPTPYWEPAEDVSIIHYTKTIIAAFGDDQGWDTPVGLAAEIVPLTRPFGNYAGNSFSGQVLINGKPLAHAEVEVEFYNEGEKYIAPSNYHVTQVVKADAQGIFTFTCPLAGWWGFAALTEADYTLKDPEGKDKGVEIGAVLWTYLDAYQPAKKN